MNWKATKMMFYNIKKELSDWKCHCIKIIEMKRVNGEYALIA